MTRVIMLFAAFVLISGCSALEKQSSAQVEVTKGSPVVYIYPEDISAYLQASVGVLPFLLPEGIDQDVGKGIGALYKDTLLGKQTFARVKFIQNDYGNYDEAIVLGQKNGTDLVLAGKVNYLIEGTEMGGTRMDISVRMLNVNTGATVWHIGQTMDQPVDYPKTDIFNFLRSSTFIQPIRRPSGAPVLTNMFAQSAVDVADVLAGARYVKR